VATFVYTHLSNLGVCQKLPWVTHVMGYTQMKFPKVGKGRFHSIWRASMPSTYQIDLENSLCFRSLSMPEQQSTTKYFHIPCMQVVSPVCAMFSSPWFWPETPFRLMITAYLYNHAPSRHMGIEKKFHL